MWFSRITSGTQRYYCQNSVCETKAFLLAYRYKAYGHGVKEQVVQMATNGSGVRDTARVLKINKNTVISTLKKSSSLAQANPNLQALNAAANLTVRLELA